MKNKLTLVVALSDAPNQAEELRIDRNGKFYWCDKGKKSWSKGVVDGNYSALHDDRIIAKI